MQLLMTVQGANGATLQIFESKITIKRKGLMSFLIQGSKGDKAIQIKSISAIQLKKPGMTKGYVQFSLSGESASKGGVRDAVKDENTVMIKNKRQYTKFVEAKSQIEELIQRLSAPAVQFTAADELKKYAELLEMGAITQEEFDRKKSELL